MGREALLDGDPRVVDEQVNAAVCLDDLAHQSLHAFGIGDVGDVLTRANAAVGTSESLTDVAPDGGYVTTEQPSASSVPAGVRDSNTAGSTS